LKVAGCALFLDSRRPRSLCFVSHAHSDHLGAHEHALSTRATAALAERRLPIRCATPLEYSTPRSLDDRTSLCVLPAGHILGSAMLHLQRDNQHLLYTGDFKLRDSATVPAAQPRQADVLVMETTYGVPLFRFPSRTRVIGQLLELVESAFRAGRQPIVLGYSLGKAQEVVRILTGAGHRVSAHGAVFHNNQTYEQLGVSLGDYRRYDRDDFHGPRALDLRERGVLVAPPQMSRSTFVTRFDNPCRIVLTGWAMLKNAVYRYGVDHALPLSDHADFDELCELVERVRPRKVYTHHGYAREFADVLRAKGLDASCARPEPQLWLFEP
jgi:Cft2 family RNA processing exonuclease